MGKKRQGGGGGKVQDGLETRQKLFKTNEGDPKRQVYDASHIITLSMLHYCFVVVFWPRPLCRMRVWVCALLRAG